MIKSVYIENMDEEQMKSAIYEAKILEKLDHPNIIRFIESFVVKNPKKSLCIVMDYADSKNLLKSRWRPSRENRKSQRKIFFRK